MSTDDIEWMIQNMSELHDEPTTENGIAALKVLRECLDDLEVIANPMTLSFGYTFDTEKENGNLTANTYIDMHGERFALVIHIGTKAPEGRRTEVAKFISQVSMNAPLGSFSMEHRTGEIYFGYNIHFKGTVFNHELVCNSIESGVLTTDAALPYLMRVIFGGADGVETAIEAADEIQRKDRKSLGYDEEDDDDEGGEE